MKLILLICLIAGSPLFASNIRPIPDDIFSTQEKADEATQIIMNNFYELWATKLSVSSPTADGPRYYLSDILNPDEADYNALAIMGNADDLWENKEDFGGISAPGGRSSSIKDLLDPNSLEQNIGAINQIFYDLDSQKVDQ